MTATGLFILRLALATVFVAHGAHTLFGVWGGPGVGQGGLDNTAAYLAAQGIDAGFLLAVVSGVTQFLGGVLIGVGFMTRWAALSLVGYTLVTLWNERLQWGFFLNWLGDPSRGHGVEYSVVIVGALVCLAVAGAGDWSLDGRRELSAESRAAARDRIRRKF
jgi:putative oxidoreductase